MEYTTIRGNIKSIDTRRVDLRVGTQSDLSVPSLSWEYSSLLE
ncbi:hypothetical protein TITUS_045 [Escherichia phage vB_Eco_Titus]|nr:hypothetical protein TITUS_045 [Escherichia phage vB_Eco_Titus]